MFTDPTLGTVTIFAGNIVPNNWMFCQGQILDIGEYTELYTVIGTTYGGDGSNTFALPDLRGRVAVSAGQSPGLSNYELGQQGGNEQIVFTASQLNHTHAVSNIDLPGPPASNLPGTTDIAIGNVPAVVAGAPAAYSTSDSDVFLADSTSLSTSGPTGSTTAAPVNIMSPFLTMNYIICIQGLYPGLK